MRLHHICLRAVFDELVLPPELLTDSALQRGQSSPWVQSLKSLKSLVLVCRSWNAIATSYLYRSVVLRRAGQVPALVRTLKDNAEFPSLIKHLTLSCYVPDEWDQVMNDCVTYLLSECHNIHTLSLHSFFTQWLHGVTVDGTRRFKISNEVLSSVTSVENMSYTYQHPLEFFSRKQYNVGPKEMTRKLVDAGYYHVLSSLPNIKDLRILKDSQTSTSHSKPSLTVTFERQHLDRIRANPNKFSAHRWLKNLDLGLEKYRVDLGLWSTNRMRPNLSLMEEVLKDFVDVHMVADHMSASKLTRGPWSRLDLWVSDMAFFEEEGSGICDNYPGVRLFDDRLRCFEGLPYLFPAEKVPSGEQKKIIGTHDIFGTRFTRTQKRMVCIQEPWVTIFEQQPAMDESDSESGMLSSLYFGLELILNQRQTRMIVCL